MVCEACYTMLRDGRLVDDHGRAVSDAVCEDFCMNCYDRNKVLIDDLAGSTE